MNWKKEGYTKGQKVFIVSKGMFTRDIHFHEGEITYVGTKILKVKTKLQKKDLEFKDSRVVNSTMFGYGYYIFKSKEEYEEHEKKVQYRYILRKKVQDGVVKLSNEQLEEILKWIEEKKRD